MDVLAIQIKIIEGRQSDQRYRYFAEHKNKLAGQLLQSCQLHPYQMSKWWVKITANVDEGELAFTAFRAAVEARKCNKQTLAT